jgi:hypothetical protein
LLLAQSLFSRTKDQASTANYTVVVIRSVARNGKISAWGR